MDFAAAVAEVVAAVKRPDKIIVARRKVNAAISFFCIDSEFKRDYQELSLAIDADSYTQSIPLTSFERWRRFHYIKRGGTKCFVKILSNDELFAKCDMRDRYYIAGDNLIVNLAVKTATLDIGWFKYPPLLTDAVGNFWLLDQAPYMVIDYAAAEIFREIGDEKSSQALRASAATAYLSFRKDNSIGS